MWFRKPVKICEHCGFAISIKKFLNKTFFVDEKLRLVLPVTEEMGRLQGCIYCLQQLEAEEATHIEKTEFPNRTIYTLKPTMKDNLIRRIASLFRARSSVPADVTSPDATLKPKTKVRTHEQSK